MALPDICRSISRTLSRDLGEAATVEKREEYLSRALVELDVRGIPSLNDLYDTLGPESPKLVQGRRAVLELSTAICRDYLPVCSNYRWGLFRLEALAAACREPYVKSQLLFAARQLREQRDAAGGGSALPEAGRKRPGAAPRWLAFGLLALLLCAGVTISRCDRSWTTSRVTPAQPREEGVPPPEAPAPERRPAGQVRPPEAPAGSFYTYTDDRGTIHLVDDPDRVPAAYRSSLTATRRSLPGETVTPVLIRGNQVLVPVRLSHRGRSVEALLVLDTGASLTAISGRLAERLGIDPGETRPGSFLLADGRTVESAEIVVETISAGPRSLERLRLLILPGGDEGARADGLLGMNYLRHFRYRVDFGRRAIEWDAE